MSTGIKRLTATALALGALTGSAAADQPEPWQLGFQTAATPIMNQIAGFHTFVLVIITLITLFVLGLLIYAMVRFNERRSTSPSRTTHNTTIEVLWTVVPIVILVIIAVPSFRLLYAQYNFPDPDVTVKATGHQWYWSYEYPDEDGLNFISSMLEEDQLQPGQPRLLAVDNDVVVPVDANVHVLVTAADVIHSWAVPAFGVKMDGVPGRLQSLWFRAEREGVYYGQCSELCGARHAFMPIAVRVVSQEEYEAWLEDAREQFATRPARDAVAALEDDPARAATAGGP